MSREPEPCLWCGDPSTLLCDGVIGFARSVHHENGELCSAPMCRRCARQVGHVCSRGSKRGCDSIDRCPVCEYADQAGPPRILTATEVRRYRKILRRLVGGMLRPVGGRSPIDIEPVEIYGRIFGTDGYTREF